MAHVANRILATKVTASPHIPILGLQLAHGLLYWLEGEERHASLPVDYLTAHRLGCSAPRDSKRGNMRRSVSTVVKMPVLNLKLTGLADPLYLLPILRVQNHEPLANGDREKMYLSHVSVPA